MIRVKKEEGHYTLKIVEKLPKRGNANWLYAIKDEPIKKGYVWTLENEYKTIYIGGSEEAGGFTIVEAGDNVVVTGTGTESDPYIISSTDPFSPTDLLTDYGITLAPVAISNSYNDLSDLPVVANNYVSNMLLVGTNLEVTGVGSGFNGIVDLSSLVFPGFTDLLTDYGITLSTVAISNDYNDLDNLPAFPSAPTGLEAINEGSGIGWRLIGRNAANYGNIGLNAIDFSFSSGASSTRGARGLRAVTFGYNNIAPGEDDFIIGYQNTNNDANGGENLIGGFGNTVNIGTNGGSWLNVVFGSNNTANGYSNFIVGDNNDARGGTNGIGSHLISGRGNDISGYFMNSLGAGLRGTGSYTTIVGKGNVNFTEDQIGHGSSQRRLFVVGNGTVYGNGNPLTSSDAFRAYQNGDVTAPSLTIALINGEATGRVLVTREWIAAQGFGSGAISDAVYGVAWNGDTTNGASKNAIYDKIESIPLPTGLEILNEGSGNGWRLIGRNAANFGNIGSGAVDFSFNGTPSALYGATGSISFAAGGSTIASNSYSAAFGHLSTSAGYAAFVAGHFLNSPSYAEATFGIFNTIYTPVSAVARDGADRLFCLGNGTSGVDRHDAVTVLKNGKVGIGRDNFETTTSAALLNVNGAVQTAGYTVATLPAGTQGMRAYVTDATATTFYSIVAGGGANVVPVFYNGTNWVIA